MKTIARLFPPLAVCLLLTLFVSACSDKDETTNKSPVKPVVVLKAYAISLSDQVEALGTAQANESITITATVAGRLEEIAFNDGQQVHKGDVIVRQAIE